MDKKKKKFIVFILVLNIIEIKYEWETYNFPYIFPHHWDQFVMMYQDQSPK